MTLVSVLYHVRFWVSAANGPGLGKKSQQSPTSLVSSLHRGGSKHRRVGRGWHRRSLLTLSVGETWATARCRS